MAKRHMVIDRTTGETSIQARDGKRYTAAEVAAAERRAKQGDPEAIALVESLEVDGADPVDLLHDCPECRAALARGERPEIVRIGRPRWARPMRWRRQKRRT